MNTVRKNRVISMVLAVVMVFSMMTTSAFAENDGITENAVEEAGTPAPSGAPVISNGNAQKDAEEEAGTPAPSGAPAASDGETEEDEEEETGTPAPSDAPVISDGNAQKNEEEESGTPAPSDAPVISDGNAQKSVEENAENGVALLNGEGDAVENAMAEVIDADGKTTGQYATLAEAIKAAKDGCTVKLIKSGETYTLTSDENFPICIESNSITLDLNGCTLKRSVNAMQQGILKVNVNKEVIVRNGTLELNDSGSSNPAQAIAMPSGWSPALTLENMTVHAAKGYAIYAQGGTLFIRSGTYGKVLIHDGNVTANLSGGSYDSVMCYDDYADLLPQGYIFAKQSDSTYIDPSTMSYESGKDDNIKNIMVIPCTHKDGNTNLFENGTCSRCGLTCTKHTYKDGNCGTCGRAILVFDDSNNYYVSLSEALEQVADGGELDTRDTLPPIALVYNYDKSVTLDGLYGNHLTNDSAAATLTVSAGRLTIPTSFNPDYPPTIINNGGGYAVEVTGGTLEFADTNYARCSAVLKGGIHVTGGTLAGGLKEGSILTKGSGSSSVSVAGDYEFVYELLEDGCAFAKATVTTNSNEDVNADTTTVGDIIPANVSALTEDVIVVKCTHKNGDTSLFEDGECTACGFACEHETVVNNTCSVCDGQMVAQDDVDKYYLDLSDALEGVADDGTVTMLADANEWLELYHDEEGALADKTVTLYMDGHSLYWSDENYNISAVGIESGKLIIADDAVVSQLVDDDVSAVSVGSNGDDKCALKFQGKATITGGMAFFGYGKLEGGLKEGSIVTSNQEFSVSVEASETYKTVRELLPVGYAYAEYTAGMDTANPTIIDGGVKQLTQDVIVVKCTHKNGDTSLLENGTCLGCGYVCPHTSIADDSKKCNTCGAQMVAQVGDSYYGTLAAAIEAAKNDGTVEVVSWSSDDYDVKESITVENGTQVTINMNNTLWQAGNTASPALTVDGGSVTLNGSGYLSLAGNSTASGVVVVKSGSLTLGESMVFGDNGWAGPAIVVEGGDLTLGKDTVLYRGVKTSAAGATLASYLPEGTAFKRYDNNNQSGFITNGYVTDLTDSIQFQLKVVSHTHSAVLDADGHYVCACGYTCDAHDFADGVCKKCGYACLHEDVTETGPEGHRTAACDTCGQPMAVKVTSGGTTTYYTQSTDFGSDSTLRTILNGADGKSDGYAPDGSTVTLLTDDLNANAVVNNSRSITLDLNGKNLIETGGIRVEAGSKLTVTGEGSSSEDDNSMWPCVFNVQGGTLVFKEMEFGGTFNSIRVGSGTLTSPREKEDAIHIGTLEIDGANAQVSFKAAAFDKIVFSRNSGSVKLGDLLGVWKDAEGNAVRSGNAFQKADGTFVPYNTEITQSNPVENVKTAACLHDSVTSGTCDYCGMENLVAAVIDGGGSIATFAAKDSSDNAKTTAIGYALKWWRENGTKKTLKLFGDFALGDVSLNAVTHPGTGKPLETQKTIDLNGHTITGGTLTANKLVTLTIADSTASKGTYAADITVNDGASLTVDGVSVGSVTLYAGSKLATANRGRLETVTAGEGQLRDYLSESTAFQNAEGKIEDGRKLELTNVTIVAHEHSDYRWDTDTHELVCFCGHVKETDTTAPVITGITDGETRYGDVTFTVTDENLDTVTVDGKTVTLDESGGYTIPADNREYTVIAEDLAGNSTTVAVTVNRIHNVTLVGGTGYTITGDPTVGYGQTYTFTVTLSDGYSRVTDSYKVLVNGVKADPVPSAETSDKFSVHVTGDLTITVEGVADITAPENVEIRIGDRSFKTLLNSIYPYNMFFKDAQTVTVNASDKGSGVNTVEYLLADAVYGKDSLPTDGWTQVRFANGTGSFEIRPNSIGSVYVRVTDADGNASVVNSTGMVVYTDSTADTESVSFTRLSAADASFKVNLNGNTVKSVSVGDKAIEQYTVSENGTITLKNAYLKTLAAGEYHITVAYNPMGIAYADGVGNAAPATTGVTLTVLRGARMLTFSAPDAVYGGEPYDGLSITDAPEGTSVQYKLRDAADSTYTTVAPTNAGSYTVQIATPQDADYNARTFTADFTISPKEVTVIGTAVNPVKNYDGSTAAEITGNGTLNGVLDGDEVNIVPGKADYADKNVGKGKTVSFTGFTLGGAAGGNYALKEQPASVTADISAIELTVENLKVKDKLYDGTAKAEIDGTPALKGAISGDDVQLVCGTPSFAQTAYDNNAAVAVSFTEFTLSGADSGNYTLAQPSGSTAWIRAWYASGSEYAAAAQGWSNQPFTVTAADGYLLSLTDTADGEWLNRLTGMERTTGDPKYLTFYVKNAATGAISTANRLAYLYETTAPLGSVTIGGVTSRTLLGKNQITFSKFFKSDVTVDVAGTDDASGVKSVEYYTSDKALTLEEVKAVTGWKPGSRFTVAAGETTRFVVYVRVTDNAGNTAYFCSDGAEIDITAPTITGVENNGVYYVTRRVTVDDANLQSVTVNGTPMETGVPFELAGDKDAVYTVAATDKVGNVTEYTVTMRPLSTITDALRGITAANVKSTNAETVRTVAGRIRAITAESSADIAGAAQWNKLLAASASCNALENRIAEVAAETARLTRAVNAYDIDKVTSADKADIEKLLAGINALLGGGNLTDAERAAQETLRKTARALLDRIAEEKSAAESDEIAAVRNITRDNVTAGDKTALEKAEKALEDALSGSGNYTETERNDLNARLDAVKEALTAIGNAEKAAGEIEKLPSVDEVQLTDRDEIERVSEIVEALTENEKTLLGKEAIGKLMALKERLDKLAAAENETALTAPGGTGSSALWIVLLLVCAGVAIIVILCVRKKKNAQATQRK